MHTQEPTSVLFVNLWEGVVEAVKAVWFPANSEARLCDFSRKIQTLVEI